jgi:outer membrane receptor protein involved in Fe transport
MIFRLSTTTAAAIAVAMPVAAQSQARSFSLDVPAQDLGAALKAIAAATGQQVAFKGAIVKGKRSQAVRGTYSADEAVAIAIRGSGLTFSRSPRGIIIVTQGATTAASPSQSASPLGEGKDEAQFDADYGGEIVVTGTNIRGVTPAGQSLTVIDRREIERSGYSNAQDVIRSLPQNFGADARSDALVIAGGNQPANSNSAASKSANLRGLGTDSTLTLVNGRRLAPGGLFGGVADISIIPVTAIERVEVLPDGASALYGADAVGGVINFVLRKDHQGFDSMVRYGGVASGNLREVQASQAAGFKWNSGNLFTSAEYTRSTPLSASDRGRTNGDFRSFDGTDRRTNQCNPGTISVGGTTYAIPAGQDGRSLTPSMLVAGSQNLCSPLADATLSDRIERWSGVVRIEQNLSDHVSVFADFLYAQRHTTSSVPFNRINLSVPATNAFYVNPTGGTGAVQVRYNLTSDLGPRTIDNEAESFSATLGLDASVGTAWTVTAYTSPNFQRERQVAILDPDPVGLRQALSDSNPSTAFNPFGEGSNTSAATLARLRGSSEGRTSVDTKLWLTNIVATGPLLSIAGRDVRLAIGAEHRNFQLETLSVQERKISGTVQRALDETNTRNVTAIFGEGFIPLIDAPADGRGIKRLNVSIAGRYERYSDFGSAFSPRLGIVFEPTTGFSFRASWARSFKAPLLANLSEASNLSYQLAVADPRSPTGTSVALVRQGSGNTDLQPESARSWTFGIDFAPPPIPNLRFSVSYFNIDFRDRIAGLPSGLSMLSANDPFIIRNPTPAQISGICSSTTYAGNFSVLPGDCLTTAVTAILDDRVYNLARTKVSGIDASLSYQSDLGPGAIYFDANATYGLKFGIQPTATSPQSQVLNTVGDPVRFRFRGAVGYEIDGWDITSIINHTGSYRNDLVTPFRPIDSWTTIDLNITYKFGKASLLAGTSISLNAQNLLDAAPPFVGAPSLDAGYDPANASLLGRFLSLTLRKKW